MNKTEILQYLNEAGLWIPGIYMSKKQCQNFWADKANSSSENSPKAYASKDLGMIETMAEVIKPYVYLDYSILEMGCNSGANLSYLSNEGYKHLYGYEINKNAIDEMKFYFPDLKANVWNNSLETCLKVVGDDSFDLVFSMAVLEHIHPSSNFIFNEIARISRKYICTVEEENCHASYIFERNYRRVFEKRGFQQIECIEVMPSNKDYTLRLFVKGI